MKTLQLLALIVTMCASLTARAASFERLYQFAGLDGMAPQGLTAGPNGVLYGTTAYGGAYNYGTVFELQPPSVAGGNWTETILYSFTGINGDGISPFAAPVLGPTGALYGTTAYSGTYFLGTVFELSPPSVPGGPWAETVISGLNGYRGVVLGNGGELYGVNPQGGLYTYGFVYELSPPVTAGGAWTSSTLYNFPSQSTTAALTITPNGVLYGETTFGGGSGAGTIFELIPPASTGGAWTERLLYTFTGGADGDAPLQPPVMASDGALYGTTSAGGSSGSGVVFRLAPGPNGPNGKWVETVLYSFESTNDGKTPDSPLIVRNGKIYGTTTAGTGAGNSGGTVFELTRPAESGAAWTETILHGFSDTAGPYGNLVMDNRGVIYGATTSGPGPQGAGVIYRILP